MIQQVLVFELLGQFEAGSLVELASALAVALHNLVGNHLTSFALQVLQLVVYHPST